MTDLETTQREIESLRDAIGRLEQGICRTFLGQEKVTELLITCLLADGHALLEGAPGLGKTTLVRSLATNLALEFRRIQFTPDLMPADIVGTMVLHEIEGGVHARQRPPVAGFAACNGLLDTLVTRGRHAYLAGGGERVEADDVVRLDELHVEAEQGALRAFASLAAGLRGSVFRRRGRSAGSRLEHFLPAGGLGANTEFVSTAEGDIDVMGRYLGDRRKTIGGGSREIQRNIISKRVLGLPT